MNEYKLKLSLIERIMQLKVHIRVQILYTYTLFNKI